MIRKIEFTHTDLDNDLLNISCSRIREIHNKIINSYYKFLSPYGVKQLWKDDYKKLDDLNDDEFIKILTEKNCN